MRLHGPVTGWKAALVAIGTLVLAFTLLNWLGMRHRPRPTRPAPPPTIVR